METLTTALEIYSSDGAAGTFKGLASVFDELVEAYEPSVILRGAFTETLQQHGDDVKVLWQHDTSEPIGRPTELYESDRGLEITARISRTARGLDAMNLIKAGVLDSLSIGFTAEDFHYRGDGHGDRIRYIERLRLFEVSVVTWGAADNARIYEAASLFRPRTAEQRIHQLEMAQLAERARGLHEVAGLRRLYGNLVRLRTAQLEAKQILWRRRP
jgi:HK97 family phage prohead protease